MPRDVNGTYSLPAGNPIVSGTLIQSTWANDTMNDLAVAMTDSLSRSGNGGMLSPFFFIDGTETNPSISFANEPSLGFFRIGTQEIGLSGNLNVTESITAPTANITDLTGASINVSGNITGDRITLDGGMAEVVGVDDGWAQLLLRNTEGGSRIFTGGTGDLYIRQTSGAGTDEDTWIQCVRNGAVKFQHNNINKLNTTSTGISVTGDIDVTDDIRMSGTSPLLDINSTDGGRADIRIRNTEGGVGMYTDNGFFLIKQTDAAGAMNDTWIRCEPDGAIGLYANNTLRAETGNAGLNIKGKINTEAALTAEADIAASFSSNNNSTAYSNTVSFLSNNETSQGSIQTANGKIPQFASPSDIRLKDNIVPKDHAEAIGRFKQINFVTYNQYDNILREGDSFENEGVIADEYELVYPDGVTTQKGDPFKVKQVGFIHGHDESVAVQYLLNKVEELEARLAALNG
jgi:hypothetical protein